MRSFINPGSSITGVFAVIAIAWGIRTFRTARLRIAERRKTRDPVRYSDFGKYFAALSPEAVRLLVATVSIPHYVVDIRPSELRSSNPLPAELAAAAVHIPVELLAACLSSPKAWNSHIQQQAAHNSSQPNNTPTTSANTVDNATSAVQDTAADGNHLQNGTSSSPDNTATPVAGGGSMGNSHGVNNIPPTPYWCQLLLCVSDDQDSGQQAAGIAASLGFQRTAVIAGGLASFNDHSSSQHNSLAATPCIHRDALALLLGRLESDVAVPRCTVLDVRRHDERTLYGSINGTLHVPVDELASALQLPADEFRAHYHFDQPAQEDVVIFMDRTNKKSYWAAQIARDAGWRHVYVYRAGVYGWRFDAGVLPYAEYQLWQAPPEPEEILPEEPDATAALEELQHLDLLGSHDRRRAAHEGGD
eukprot:jgi/Chrzof1/189/Cz01g06130.t1